MLEEKRNIDTLSEAMHTLNMEGYTGQFISIENGLHETSSNRIYVQNEIDGVEQFQFDWMSHPEKKALLLALECKDGTKGTLFTNCETKKFQNIKKINN